MTDYYVPQYKHELIDYIKEHCHSLARFMELQRKPKKQLYAIYFRLRGDEKLKY